MIATPIQISSQPRGAPSGPRRVLVVDDSRAQRRLLGLSLQRAGYFVTEAGSGEEALVICADQAFDIVISDWVMPGMSGLDFCKSFRALPRDSYSYFILLTSKSDSSEVAGGLDGGADDYLTKPVAAAELRARLRAGERILGMQEELVEKNRLIGTTLDELQKLYDSLDRDLIEARKLQQTLQRDRFVDFGRASASILLRPSGHVGGDLVGVFAIDERRVALYSIDVSGHGVASAMMTARLAGLLSAASPERNFAMTLDRKGQRGSWPPELVAQRFNCMMLDELQVEQYFTMVYAEVDLDSGAVMLVQAGHPHPAILRADGGLEFLGQGGLPIGLIPGATYDRVEARLMPGDRLLLTSDGVTECPGPDGQEFGQEGLARFLARSRHESSESIFESLLWALSDHANGADLPDDISGILFDYRG